MKPTPTPDVINLVVAAREFWDANNDLSDESRALDKALEAFSSLVPYENEPDDAAFSVKPAKALEWRLNEEGWQSADTFFGGYRVERNPHDHWCWGVYFHGETGVGLNSADNFEAAKAAAQADFNERISSSLDAKPAPDLRDLIIIGDTAYPVHSEVCRAFNELSVALSSSTSREGESRCVGGDCEYSRAVSMPEYQCVGKCQYEDDQTAGRKLSLWFFRDLSGEQRGKLFRLFGMNDAQKDTNHGYQAMALSQVVRALTSGKDGR